MTGISFPTMKAGGQSENIILDVVIMRSKFIISKRWTSQSYAFLLQLLLMIAPHIACCHSPTLSFSYSYDSAVKPDA